MMVQLSHNAEKLVCALMASGRYASESEVVEAALRLLERRAQAKNGLETLLLEGLNSGPSLPMTSDNWDEIEREGQRLIADRKTRSIP